MPTTKAVVLLIAGVALLSGCNASLPQLIQNPTNAANPIMANICRIRPGSPTNPLSALAPQALTYVTMDQLMYKPMYGQAYRAAYRPMYGQPHHPYASLPRPYQSVAVAPQQLYFFRGHEVLVTGLDGMLQQRAPIEQLFPSGPKQVNAAFYNRQLNNMMLYDCHREYGYQLTPNGFALVQAPQFMPSRARTLRGMVEISPGHSLLYYNNDVCRQYDPLRNTVVKYPSVPPPQLRQQLSGFPQNMVSATLVGGTRLGLFTNYNSYVYDMNANQIVCGPTPIDDFIHTDAIPFPPPPQVDGVEDQPLPSPPVGSDWSPSGGAPDEAGGETSGKSNIKSDELGH